MDQSTCSVEACANTAYARGLCSGHYQQARAGKPFSPVGRRRTKSRPLCGFGACGRPSRTQGLCDTHYKQSARTGELEPIAAKGLDLATRLSAHTDKRGDCWVWTGPLEKGYGRMSVAGRLVRVHRIAYMLANGELGESAQVDHRCRNRACVRPDHLQAVTPKENAENLAPTGRGTASGVRGVTWHSGTQKWRARAGHAGRVLELGYFDTIADASAAVVAKRLELHTNNLTDRG